ncbi:ferric reductase-like transmembrane domain-containing protein [Haliangium ochraceum]|uniref:Ferric reductase domain protein protein transmembrane component domain protein n=1 Tax=Haliangium ochraceum (strain DSM 14365 / JCM 11303 / SMP-2) TaxID=502025 RepID=D0LKX2_HALO1|nr:ferric reductase-like transmembrane domain-containing protein [Haliangium ochraceum]ACY16692.1 Ferric reductase domain protein protein transmembrane component domain protein [Haliangium ochraceum DSM 14365]
MSRTDAPPMAGKRWIWLSLAFDLVLIAAIVFGDAASEDALRSGLRITARVGVVIFALTFAVSALNSLYRAAWSKALLRRRRALGLSFGVVHLGHGALILALMALYPESIFPETELGTFIGGGLGYVAVLVMMATSTDSAVRRLGHRRWQRLHRVGMYILWVVFVFTYLGLATVSPAFAAPLILLLAAYGLRVLAALRRRAKRRQPARSPA